MALIVEDGTGKSDAESYISVADADTYFSNRGNAAWADLTTEQKEQALRKATDYMVQAYRLRWKGVRKNTVQALDWPRSFVPREDYQYAGLNGYTTIGGSYYYPSDSVPEEVKRACAELAVRASAGVLWQDAGAQVKSESVGPISVTYADGARQGVAYKSVDGMLAAFLGSPGAIEVRRS